MHNTPTRMLEVFDGEQAELVATERVIKQRRGNGAVALAFERLVCGPTEARRRRSAITELGSSASTG